MTLSGLGDQLSGSLELEPERIFVAPPKRNAHFRVPSPLGLYIIKRDPIRPESGKWTARGTPQHCTGPRGPNGGGDGPKAGDSKLGAKTGNQSWEPKLGAKTENQSWEPKLGPKSWDQSWDAQSRDPKLVTKAGDSKRGPCTDLVLRCLVVGELRGRAVGELWESWGRAVGPWG